MIKRNKNEKVLPAVHPNCGIEAQYRRALKKLVEEMHASFLYWLRAAYKSADPIMAQDASAVQIMEKAIRALVKRWKKRFDYAAPALANWFSKAVADRSDKALQRILRKGGISVKFKMTKAQKEIIDAGVAENVALIKSIPQRFHDQVMPLVMESVKQGRKLDVLTKELQKKFHVSRNRAILIARDQNNKATAQLQRARQLELGIEEAIWLHSGRNGKGHFRPTHVRKSGKRYNIKKGWYDPHEKKWIHPGELINCACVSKPIIPGFS